MITALLSFDISVLNNPCQPQIFSIPSNVVHYLSKNVSSPYIYQKLIQTCKYFYLKKRIIVINKLESSQIPYIWKAYEKSKGKRYIPLDIRNLPFEMWLIGEFNICNKIPAGYVNFLLKKVTKCDITSLYLNKYEISYNEFLALTSSMKITHFAMEDIIVKEDNGRIVPFEDILARVPNVSYCAYNIDDDIDSVYTSETASKMAQLSPFTNLKYFHIFQISDQFNPEDFCDFIKKNSSTVDYLITFHDTVSIVHKRWFKYIIDKMLNSWENGKDKPSISTIAMKYVSTEDKKIQRLAVSKKCSKEKSEKQQKNNADKLENEKNAIKTLKAQTDELKNEFQMLETTFNNLLPQLCKHDKISAKLLWERVLSNSNLAPYPEICGCNEF